MNSPCPWNISRISRTASKFTPDSTQIYPHSQGEPFCTNKRHTLRRSECQNIKPDRIHWCKLISRPLMQLARWEYFSYPFEAVCVFSRPEVTEKSLSQSCWPWACMRSQRCKHPGEIAAGTRHIESSQYARLLLWIPCPRLYCGPSTRPGELINVVHQGSTGMRYALVLSSPTPKPSQGPAQHKTPCSEMNPAPKQKPQQGGSALEQSSTSNQNPRFLGPRFPSSLRSATLPRPATRFTSVCLTVSGQLRVCKQKRYGAKACSFPSCESVLIIIPIKRPHLGRAYICKQGPNKCCVWLVVMTTGVIHLGR